MRSASSPSFPWRRSSRLRAAVRSLPPARELLVRGHACLDGLGQPHLVVFGQQRILADIGQVEADEIFLVALDALLGQGELLVMVR